MRKKQANSITGKLTQMNLIVCAIALFLACTGFVGYDFISFRENVVRNLSMQAQLAGANAVSALVFDDRQSAQRTVEAFRSSRNILAMRLYDVEGRPFATYQRDKSLSIPERAEIAQGSEESYQFAHGKVILVQAISFGGKRAGYVLVESDLERLLARVRNYTLIAALMLAVSLGIAFFVSRIALRAIANPVIRLAEAAQRVSEERNYSVRAQRGKEEGELGMLVDTFNQMLEQIEQRDQNLLEAHQQLEGRVQERTAELVAANKELESFSYSVSHDLRAPLRSIDGFSLALEEDYGEMLDAPGKNYIHRIRTATQRMGVLIDDLLNLSRVTRAEIRKERVDLSEMAKSVAAELVRATDAQREVEWVIGDGMEAYGDTRLLRVVLDNLLGNAWKYTSKHKKARIEFSKQQHNGGFAYFVKDDGAGFDPAYSERLFGAFQRLHGVADFAGTGVGLATVHRIILRHGGKIWAESEVEKGATFYFTM